MDMSEDRKECHKCLSFNRCFGGADYGSIYCVANRKYRQGNDSIYDTKLAVMQQQINEKDKRIQELEEERQLVGMPVKNKRDGTIGIVLHQWENGSVAVLERINPRVINTHDSWNTLEIITDEVKQSQTESGSIPKQVVNLKIANLKKQIEEKDKILDEVNSVIKKQQGTETDLDAAYQYYDETYDEKQKLNYQVNILEKLLEGEK